MEYEEHLRNTLEKVIIIMIIFVFNIIMILMV